jgi:membrane protease YdiL (CAAX protease family)
VIAHPGVAGRWFFVGVLLGMLSGALMISITTLLLFALGNYELTALRDLQGMAPVASGIFVVARMEEIVFRGVLFRIGSKPRPP